MRIKRSHGADPDPAIRTAKWRLRLLLWAGIVSLIFGAIGFGTPIENLMRDVRNKLHPDAPSGDVVVVAIDDKSIKKLDQWPWARAHHATIIERLNQAGASRIFFDVDFSSSSLQGDDRAFEQALRRSQAPVTLATFFVEDPKVEEPAILKPKAAFRQHAKLATINFPYNFRGEVRRLPYALDLGGQIYPSFASDIAGVRGSAGEMLEIDFSIDPGQVPTVSAIDVIEGRVSRSMVSGKTMIIGATTVQARDTYLAPGHGILPGVYIHVLAAETLMAGIEYNLGWLIPLLFALMIGAMLLFRVNSRRAALGFAGLVAIYLFVPTLLDQHLIFTSVVPSLLFLGWVGGVLAWSNLKQHYRARGSVNAISGLPNLAVLRQHSPDGAFPVVVAKVHNYAEIASALSTEGEAALVHQIANRLTLIAPALKLYQSDEGIFAWFAEPEAADTPGDHLDALYEIFRSPMFVLNSQIDVSVTFGIDGRIEQSVATRLSSALVAADEALRDGLRWKQCDPAQVEDIGWKLSMLSQLDHAIDNGDLWIAFQPKLDIASRRIIGAEALARWNHPEKGEISPIDFVLAAEQSGRIGKLTDHVLACSIEAAARLNRNGVHFNVAVNLSARQIDDHALIETVAKLLAKHELPPACLTLEITETAALAGSGRNIEILEQLRKMGVGLSIDDYGTGLSTLDYLKRIPATEIKIDQSFIQAIEKSHSDMLMVHSTVQLAHSLGQKVVAEGVERAETLEMLARMGCDIAQGYLIGHPLTLQALEKRLLGQRRAA
ncbi:MAG: EAL domain-containing protein [Pseudomonadota bacterium]|nr:EAL domain-containing protein [Pseudomonadota bacterium]